MRSKFARADKLPNEAGVQRSLLWTPCLILIQHEQAGHGAQRSAAQGENRGNGIGPRCAPGADPLARRCFNHFMTLLESSGDMVTIFNTYSQKVHWGHRWPARVPGLRRVSCPNGGTRLRDTREAMDKHLLDRGFTEADGEQRKLIKSEKAFIDLKNSQPE